jgi:hypothetical protein
MKNPSYWPTPPAPKVPAPKITRAWFIVDGVTYMIRFL